MSHILTWLRMWLRQHFEIHSPSAHLFRTCWCFKYIIDINSLKETRNG